MLPQEVFTATIRKRHNRYQAQVRIGLVSRSASFSLRAEVRAWAAGIEAVLLAEIKAHRAHSPENIAEIMHRYLACITPSKKTAKDERRSCWKGFLEVSDNIYTLRLHAAG